MFFINTIEMNYQRFSQYKIIKAMIANSVRLSVTELNSTFPFTR